MELVADIDWGSSVAISNALIVLNDAFSRDPLMQLFDKDARYRLAAYIVTALHEEANKVGLNMYVAGTFVKHVLMPRGIYSVFGTPLASNVAYLVQKSLYPASYASA
jgi:hypothetical protein